MNQKDVPVMIVGAGGAGLSLSLLLQQQGIRSMLVERRKDVSVYPRARNLNFRTLEIFRGLGIIDEVHAIGAPATHIIRKEFLSSSQQKEFIDPVSLIKLPEALTPRTSILVLPAESARTPVAH